MAHLKKAVIEVPRASVAKHNMIYSLNPLPPYSAQYSNKPSNLSAAVVAQKVAHSTADQETSGSNPYAPALPHWKMLPNLTSDELFVTCLQIVMYILFSSTRYSRF